jgi:hypothetical protein
MKTRLWLCLLIAVLGSGTASGQQHQHAPPPCQGADLSCATAATPAFGTEGDLWLAWSAGGRVSVGHSRDLGHSFETTTAVNPEPERIDTGPDARPKIVVDKNAIVVAYAVFQDDHYNGRVMVSRSVDGGASFTAPRPITDDATSQRFETLTLDPDGNIFAAWLDKRNVAAMRRAGGTYPGAALAYSWSMDGGESFLPTRIARDNVCECCRLGIGFAAADRPAVLFRNIFDSNTRDHTLLVFQDRDTPGPLRRISVDDWEIDACPHHGPALAIATTGTIHAAWFTAGKARQGLFYARSHDGGAEFSTPMPIGDPSHRPARPYLLASEGTLRLVWKEFDGEVTAVKMIISTDDGNSWSPPKEIATTGDSSDHPLLLGDGRRAYLSWLTHADGYRLMPLDDLP